MLLVIEITYTQPIEIIESHLQAHRDFLQAQYDAGYLLASGPQNPRSGGIILALCSKEKMQELIATDPFHLYGVADYRIIEFDPVKMSPDFKHLLEQRQ